MHYDKNLISLYKLYLWSFVCLVFLLRIAYLGLTLGLRTVSFFLCILGLLVLRQHVQKQERSTMVNGGSAAAGELQALRKEENNSCNSEQCPQNTDYDPERETRL